MKRLRRILSLGAVVALVPFARADLVMSLSSAVQNSARGQEIVFSGTLTNTGAEKLYLNNIAAVVNTGSATELPLKPNSFFLNVPGVLLPGETYQDSELFRVALKSTASASDYRGAVTIRGGNDIIASADLATADFSVLSPAVDVQASDASASEFGPDPGAVSISRSGGTDIDLVVPFTMSGSAVAGTDYQALPGTVTIPAGSSAAIVSLLPIPNDIAQGDRNAQLTLSASSEFNLGMSTSATVVINDKPADAWRFANFGANANDPEAADGADWDDDGVTNLLEFALDLDPKNGQFGGLPLVGRAGDYLTISFSPNADAVDVSFIVEGSADLVKWSTANVEVLPTLGPANVITFRYLDPISTSHTGFLRLRVTRE